MHETAIIKAQGVKSRRGIKALAKNAVKTCTETNLLSFSNLSFPDLFSP
jgi:hypothetical protein